MTISLRQLILFIVTVVLCSTAEEQHAEGSSTTSSCSAPSLPGVSQNGDGSSSSGCGCATATARKHPMAEKNGVQTPLNPRKVHIPPLVVEQYSQTAPSKLLDIRGGSFIMGTNIIENPMDGEGPPRRVEISDFQLDETEVSIAQFARFVIETGYETDAERYGWSFAFERTLSKEVLSSITQAVAQVPWWLPVNGANWLFPDGPDRSAFPNKMNHPVTHVSHNDAKAYCDWLGLRLPTEAEFEYAMRGGMENKTYPWGDELVPDEIHRANLWQGNFPDLNTIEDGYEYSAPVDAFGPQNAFGLYNIVGNAWEWVADAWITNFSKLDLSKPLKDPQIEIQGKQDKNDTERVKRGGSYMCHKSYCLRYRTASRSSNSADSSAQNLGFRCAN